MRFMVSTEAATYQADLVRFGRHDQGDPVRSSLTGLRPGRKQPIHSGSYIVVPDCELLQLIRGFALQMWIWPTTPNKLAPQGLLAKWSDDRNLGFGHFLGGETGLALWIGKPDGERELITTQQPLHPRHWYFVAASYDADTGQVALYQYPAVPQTFESPQIVTATLEPGDPGVHSGPLTIGAGFSYRDNEVGSGYRYNGKIESPRLFGRPIDEEEVERLRFGMHPSNVSGFLAGWDFSHDVSSAYVSDISGNGLRGEVVNMPTRAMTGHIWDGSESDFRRSPEQWGAIHFHDDDIEDAGWDPDFEWRVPESFPSGVYSLILSTERESCYVPFFVAPPKSAAVAEVLFLVPTYTYLAYANHRYVPGGETELMERMTLTKEAVLDPRDHYLSEHPELGASLYGLKSDGSGCCYSSRLRPVPNMDPDYRWWGTNSFRHLSADLCLVRWLERKEFSYDILTDENLDEEGADSIGAYRVVITGSHPEYWTASMLLSLEAYLASGGRLMYLGGNGFYWVTSRDELRPHVIEVRRGWAASRPWESMPGETHHSTTGEPGGLWRHRGKPPQALVGVGPASMGWGRGSGYARLKDSFNERAAFVFDGISSDEVIGDFDEHGASAVTAGAAGDEMDHADCGLGTPRHTLLLASSAGRHSDHFQPFVETVPVLMPRMGGEDDLNVGADMTLFDTPQGGAVFSVGSVNWILNLARNDFDNNVSRVTENVLRRFVLPGQS